MTLDSDEGREILLAIDADARAAGLVPPASVDAPILFTRRNFSTTRFTGCTCPRS
jgi:hypothetical protein